jgi:hypothetical protein
MRLIADWINIRFAMKALHRSAVPRDQILDPAYETRLDWPRDDVLHIVIPSLVFTLY